MSCTHDCGCTQTVKDARTDDWGQIAPESARGATLTHEQPVKAPGQAEGVLRPPEPVLPRQIKPEDVRVGMVVECRDLVRVTAVHSGIIEADRWEEFMADAESETCERQWWLIEDAPEPVDPDAELVERMARAIDAEPGFNVSDMAYAALRALREIRDVTPRAEQ